MKLINNNSQTWTDENLIICTENRDRFSWGLSNKLWRLNSYFEGNSSYYCCWYVDYIVYFTCYISFNSLWLIWVLFPCKRLCIQLPKGKLVIYFEVETYFNDHQKHCQYKLYNLKNVHNCRNPVNSLNFVLRLDMNRWELMVAKIASWYFHF